MIWKYSLLKAVGNKNDSLEQLLRSFTVPCHWKITHGGWNTKKKKKKRKRKKKNRLQKASFLTIWLRLK